MTPRYPALDRILLEAIQGEGKPVAIVLAGHNGSGKSTLWYERLADQLEMPPVNADRLTTSILPEAEGTPPRLRPWAQCLRDSSALWQGLSQDGVRLFRALIMKRKAPFAFETVFSYWEKQKNGAYASKIDDIKKMRRAGYFVVLIFVGLAGPHLSVLRVQTRKRKGGHDVPLAKLLDRFPRTQAAIGQASGVADLTVMVDNSLDATKAFSFVRAQRKKDVLFDIRDPSVAADPEVRVAAEPWLAKVVGAFRPRRAAL